MTNYIIEPVQQVSLPVRGSDAVFPVRRIYCIGRNYADHAIEMGHDPDKEPPFFFQKNAENVDTSGEFPYPPQTSDVHFEMEMIVALKSGGVDIREEDALNHVFGYGLGLDMTRRDLQGEAKKMGRPWEIGKAFERSAPMSELVPASGTPAIAEASSVKAPKSSGSRLCRLVLPQARANSWASMVSVCRKLYTRSAAASGSRRLRNSGSCVAIPTGQRPVWQ